MKDRETTCTTCKVRIAMANLTRPFLTTEPAWASLQKYFNDHGREIDMLDMFKKDKKRFEAFRLITSIAFIKEMLSLCQEENQRDS